MSLRARKETMICLNINNQWRFCVQSSVCFHTRFTFPAIQVESAFSPVRSVEFLDTERAGTKARIFYQAKITYLGYVQTGATTPNNVASVCTGLKVWPVSNFAQQHATTSNNMQQGVQADATCNIPQCWKLLVNNVASVCTQPYCTHRNAFRKRLADIADLLRHKKIAVVFRKVFVI